MAINKIQAHAKKADVEDPYRISVQEEASYADIFRKLDTKDGFVSGKRAAPLLRKSGLPQEMLAKVWALSDQDLDGRLSLKEFCTAMNLVRCVRQRGLPPPEPVPHITRKKQTRSNKRSPEQKQVGALKGKLEATLPRSPQRRSRMASLIGGDQQVEREAQDDDANILKWDPRQAAPSDREQSERRRDSDNVYAIHDGSAKGEPAKHELTSTGYRDEVTGDQAFKAASWAACQGGDLSPPLEGAPQTREAEGGNPEVSACVTGDEKDPHETISGAVIEATSHRGNKSERGLPPSQRRRPNLRQLNANDVNAVFVEGQRAINSLRDVQSLRVLVRGLDRLSAKDMARGVPLIQLLGSNHLACARKRAEKATVREVELEQATATAAERWKLKPVPEHVHSDEISTEPIGSTTGHLVVAGLPLLDEDIDIIVHLLRRNHGFKRLDLSRCFLSDKHFVALAQALAWNCRIEEVWLKECVFTGVGAAALADVLAVNNHIESIDIRACQGLDERDLQRILRVASEKSCVKKINGMELAALRAEGTEVLDLSGWELGYVEAVIVAHCLGKRANGLEGVDLHNNCITTEAFTALMVALRKQSELRSLDLSQNQIDERTFPEIAELLNRNAKLADVSLKDNRMSCTEFEHVGLDLMKLLSGNNTITCISSAKVICQASLNDRLSSEYAIVDTLESTVCGVLRYCLEPGNDLDFNETYREACNMEGNDVSPKMLTIIAEKLAANRAVRRDMTFVDCLRLKYPRIIPRPVLADPRKLHLADADVHFMAQEGIPSMRTTVHTYQQTVLAPQGVKPGLCLDFFFVNKCEVTGNGHGNGNENENENENGL